MWIIYTILHCFCLSIVNYIDEFLSIKQQGVKKMSIHKRVGALVIVSTLFNFIGASVIFAFLRDLSAPNLAIILGLSSAIPSVLIFVSYFYMLMIYPAHQVVPLFQISVIWALLIETFQGASLSTLSLVGVIFMVVGAYVLDAGGFYWKIPTKLLLVMIPSSLMWTIIMLMAKFASTLTSPLIVTFYQLIGDVAIGVIIFLLVKTYRQGFLERIKIQGKVFIGSSVANESMAQLGYLFSILAVAAAPLVTYFTALSAIQSIFLLAIFYLFPIHERQKVSKSQFISIILITLGVFMIEFYK